VEVIHCENVTKLQGKAKALDQLSFSIKENTITGLIGRNGAGKTTLLKILGGLWRETSGEVKVLSRRPFNSLYVSENSIYIDDAFHFPSHLNLKEILREGERFYPNWNRTLAERLFDYFEFHPKQTHANLSKGKRSTFNMIIGLASRCKVTLYDEPTAGMDRAVRKEMYRVLLKDYLEYPRTIIISSHYLEELEDLLEDVLLLDNGKKVLHLPMDELKEFAVGLTGRSEVLLQWLRGKTILHQQNAGPNELYAVVKKEDISLPEAQRLGMTISPVSSSDVCVYITDRGQGGIDRVFR